MVNYFYNIINMMLISMFDSSNVMPDGWDAQQSVIRQKCMCRCVKARGLNILWKAFWKLCGVFDTFQIFKFGMYQNLDL